MANQTISDLTAATALALEDLLEVVDDPSGTPASRKATLEQVRALLSALPVNTQTASYTLVLGDAGKTVEMNVASANNLTVPPNSSVAFPVGTVVEVCQVGAGQTTVVAGSGVTIRTPETLVLTGQWSTVSLRKRGTDEWVLAGDVEAAP
jgi:hypothetical protein